MAGQRFAVNNSELVAGREGNINLGFDPGASRRHASFSRTGAGVFVRDLGSTNGTMVNGVRVQEMALRLGDTVRIGGTTFRLE
jgi:pSer/pThr/pTyr-binding forkhead associated (FHA) protein